MKTLHYFCISMVLIIALISGCANPQKGTIIQPDAGNASAQDNPEMLSPTAAPGILNVSSDPQGGMVFVDNESKGITPLVLNVSPGVHELRIVLNNFSSYHQVQVTEGEYIPIAAHWIRPDKLRQCAPDGEGKTAQKSIMAYARVNGTLLPPQRFIDSCINESALVHWTCNDDQLTNEVQTCTCVDGRCVD